MRTENGSDDRVILHCDANSFFVSVELINHPEYRNVPVAVCGNRAERHGIVFAKNIPAKRYGIETAETVSSALRKCPHLIMLEPHGEEYARVSRALNELYVQYTDLVEPFSIDESWLDVTGSRNLFGTGAEIADTIRRRVREEIGITVSVGVSFNKIFAKLGSDYKKPDATTVISRDNMRQIVYPLPTSALLFVGHRASEALEKQGIRTIGDLAAASPLFLSRILGKQGEQLSAYARGEENTPVLPYTAKRERKSIGSGMTFPRDLENVEEVRAEISALADDVATKLRLSGMKCTVLCLSVKDTALRTVTRQRQMDPPVNLTRAVTEAAMAIYRTEWQPGKKIRALTVTAMQLVPADSVAEQIGFFGEAAWGKAPKAARVEAAMDDLRSRYGASVVRYAVTPDSAKQGNDGHGDDD